ncbi:uncharacterized protein LOC124307531 isoform X1 [Neodiprion virginianus]|uniref:uncharacterized protein LOC124307531 isoform X1 n=1 Tax=Neodiprion virginianus TaxID=2961670 RepID=UPI001EE6F22D|nr:uncharacterized protein LOC124307531 isoform X1 [Neodiprion virginianus]
MQNWNQWQMPAGAMSAPMPPTPAGFTAPGADPMAMMQSYMQYYNQPAPSGYTAEQWAAAQQQNWTQWQQWQQQFQQWQAQYGEKYQETMKQLSAQGLTLPNVTQAPPLPSSQPLPPLPKEEHAKPPLPPDNNKPFQYANMPPPHQNNLPLFPAKTQNSDYSAMNTTNYSQAPPLPPGQPPPPLPNPQEPQGVNLSGEKRAINTSDDFGSAKKTKLEDEELTEAEKTFDAQFKQWEEQFNKWKQQNANHPDKTQYKQYEAKWTSWREKLIERREQMRKKREQQKLTSKVDSEKTKNIPGGDKILNILSSSENQGLINNLLGIGKTLGLTGKQDAENSSKLPGNTRTVAPSTQQHAMSQPLAMIAPTMTSNMTHAAWAAQQWAAQYNANITAPSYSGFQFLPGIAGPPIAGQSTQVPQLPQVSQGVGNDFSLPPPNLGNSSVNFSQPPPGFGANDSRQMLDSGLKQNDRNIHDRPPLLFDPSGDKKDGFGGNEQFSQSTDNFQSVTNRTDEKGDRFTMSDRTTLGSQFSIRNKPYDRDTQKSEFGMSNRLGGNQFGSDNERYNQPADRFGTTRPGSDFSTNDHSGPGNQRRQENDCFGNSEDRDSGKNRFSITQDRDSGINRFARDNDTFAPNSDRFSRHDRIGPGVNRSGHDDSNFGLGSDRFGSSNDRFGLDIDRFSAKNDRFGSDVDRFSSNNDRFGSSSLGDQFRALSKDRFGTGLDRFSSGNSLRGSSNDRLSLGNERFESGSNRFNDRDNFNKNSTFGRDNLGPGNERFNRNDRLDISDPFDSKDLSYVNDNRRDSFGDNSRGSNKNVRPFEASDNITPELRKLMEKRRAAMDVFKPRDDVFNPVRQNSLGSLSESFKKITGELPYTSRNLGDMGTKNLGLGHRGSENLMSRGPGDFGPRSMGTLHSNNNFGPQSSRGIEFGAFGSSSLDKLKPREEFAPSRNEFGPPRNEFAPPKAEFSLPRNEFAPSRNEFGPPRNEFGISGNEFGPPRSQGKFGPRGQEDLERGTRNDETAGDQSVNLGSKDKENFDHRDKGRASNEQAELICRLNTSEQGNNALEKDKILQLEPPCNILPLEKPPWLDTQFSEQNLNDNVNDGTNNNSASQNSGLVTNSERSNNEDVEKAAKSPSKNIDQESDNKDQDQSKGDTDKPMMALDEVNTDGKDRNALPFMGENDPKPEDLNMEPPPELPNLGPLTETPNMPAFRSSETNRDSSANSSGPIPPPLIPPRGPNPLFFDGPGSSSGPFRPGGPNIDQFGPRGPNVNRFEFRAPIDRQFGPRGLPFGLRGSSDTQFRPRGPNDILFGPRGSNNIHFGPRGPNDAQFGPRGPNDTQFGARGPNDTQFGPRGPNDAQFGPRGPNDAVFGSRGPNDTQFGPRGLNDTQFGPRNLNEGPFGPKGLGDSQFRSRASEQFGSKGIHDNQFNASNQRGPNDSLLGGRLTTEQFGPIGRGFSGPRGPGGGPFSQRPMNPPFAMSRDSNDGQFRPRGPNEGSFGLRGSNVGQRPAIPSLLGLQFDKQPKFDLPNACSNIPNQSSKGFESSSINMDESKTVDRRISGIGESDPTVRITMDQRPKFGPGVVLPQSRPTGLDHRTPFAQGVMERRSSFEKDIPGDGGQSLPFTQGGQMNNELRSLIRHGGSSLNPLHSQEGPEQRPFIQGGLRGLEKIPGVQGGSSNFDQRMEDNVLEQRPPFVLDGQGSSDSNMTRGREQKLGFDPTLRENKNNSQFDSGFRDRLSDHDDRRRPPHGSGIDEFRVGKQFNYNHGGSAVNKMITEIIPEKVIDYGHLTKAVVHEYITPVETFDYGHGNLKPVVPEHEIIPRKDFQHWEETEQSLKEYDERLRLYAREHEWKGRGNLRDDFKFDKPHSRERDWSRPDRRSFECDDRRPSDRDLRARRDRDNREERKERDHERDKDRCRDDRDRDDRDRDDRDREYGRNVDREDRSSKDGSDRRDKNRDTSDRNDRMKVEQNKECNRDDDRSKGNVSHPEHQSKSNANTSQETSTSEAKNDSAETTSTKMELPRMPNYTMVDDILFQPGRQTRPPKIVIILRGPPGSGKSFVAKLIKDKEVEQGGSAPRILSLDDYFLVEKEKETKDDNGKKVVAKEMVYEYEEAMEPSYLTSLVKAFKKNITDGYFNFIILDCINEKISDYEEMWSFAKTKGFQVYVCEMEMDVHICLKRNIHNRTEDEINKIVDYFEPTPNHHLKLDVNGMLQEEAIDEVHMEDSHPSPEDTTQANDDSQDSQDEQVGISKWEQMDADNKLDRLDGLAKKKNENRLQTMEDFLQVPDYYNMEDTSGKKRVRWADLEERKEQEKLRAVGFVVGHTNWDRMMDPTKGQSALTRTKYI